MDIDTKVNIPEAPASYLSDQSVLPSNLELGFAPG